MKVLIWHGWLLEGSGSNVYTAKVAEVLRGSGHDVVVVCQEPHPERYPWIDAWATLDANGPSTLTESGAERTGGRCVLLRPRIGDLLPTFVIDRYEGFGTVRRFIDLTDEQLSSYLAANVGALRAAVAWHDSRIVIAGHAIPGPVIAARALGPGRYVANVHGSDIEYAIREQDRYVHLAHEGLTGAKAVIGGSRDVLERCEALVPGISGLLEVIPPGVDTGAFRPRPRRDALLETADLVDDDPSPVRGRPASLDLQVIDALARRDAGAIDALAGSYDQGVPDPGASATLRRLADSHRPIVGYLGKLIPQKGVELLLAAREALPQDPAVLIVGFGSHREWLAALAIALRNRDGEALEWLSTGHMAVDLSTLSDRHRHGRRRWTCSSPGASTIATRLAPSLRWMCSSSLRSWTKRSAWWPRKVRPPARSRWSPGIRAWPRSPRRLRATSAVRGCSRSSRNPAPGRASRPASTGCCRCRPANATSSERR